MHYVYIVYALNHPDDMLLSAIISGGIEGNNGLNIFTHKACLVFLACYNSVLSTAHAFSVTNYIHIHYKRSRGFPVVKISKYSLWIPRNLALLD